MEKLYRLEFNENQQEFHLGDLNDEKNPNDWFTIFEHCSSLEFEIYEAYINRINYEKFTKNYLLECAKEVEKFHNNLLDKDININFCK